MPMLVYMCEAVDVDDLREGKGAEYGVLWVDRTLNFRAMKGSNGVSSTFQSPKLDPRPEKSMHRESSLSWCQ